MDGYTIPHRKPVGAAIPAPLRPAQPELQQQPLMHQQQHQQIHTQYLRQSQSGPSHAHSRTVSSSVFPASTGAPTMSPTTGTFTQTIYPQKLGHSRRTASTATASTTSSTGGGIPGRQTSSVSITLRRSTSGRSGQSVTPTSYVALMRKQKATVWCDRSQTEDPRVTAQAKAAKMRATMEVVGGPAGIRTSTAASSGGVTGGVRSKIRHHGAKPVGYSPATLLVGAQGVPARLSASEVGDEDNSDDGSSNGQHRRTGSGRSSLASNPQRLTPLTHRPNQLGASSTPPNASGYGISEPPAEELLPAAPVPAAARRTSTFQSDRNSKNSKGSGSSGEERKFGNVGDMEAPLASVPREEGKTADDLIRRGSVDERAMTMRGPRLYVANPDLSD